VKEPYLNKKINANYKTSKVITNKQYKHDYRSYIINKKHFHPKIQLWAKI